MKQSGNWQLLEWGNNFNSCLGMLYMICDEGTKIRELSKC